MRQDDVTLLTKKAQMIAATRKEYSAPQLMRLGTVREITQGVPGTTTDAAVAGDPSGII